jgi:hypothetical protein
MSARIVQIGKRRWLAGMTWSSYEDVPSKEELGEDAAHLSASWVALRTGESAVQGGFSAAVAGVKAPSKLFSLAAMVADSREQPWLGIFKIEEGVWWYVAVRDGHAILPDGDIIGGEQEIYDARERHAGFTDWNYIEGDVALLEEFIDEIDAKPTRVRALNGGKRAPLVAAGMAAAIAIGAGGGWSYLQNLEAEKQAEAAAFARVRASLVAAAPPAPVQQAAIPPSPAPNAWVAACREVLAPLPLSQYGWVLKDVACAGQQASVLWVAEEGATVAAMPEGTVSEEGKSVLQSVPLSGLAPQAVDDAVALSAAKHAARAWAQQSGFVLRFADLAAPVLPGAPAAPAPATAGTSGVVLETHVSPFGLDFSVVPGLRLTQMNTTGSGWHIEGILYGR